MREKAAEEDVLVLHLIQILIGQTYFVVADCEPARKERINQNRRMTADQFRGRMNRKANSVSFILSTSLRFLDDRAGVT